MKARYKLYIAFLVVQMAAWLLLDWNNYGQWNFFTYTVVHTFVCIPLLIIHSYINIRLLLLKERYILFMTATILLIVFSGAIAYFFYPVVSEDIITYHKFFINRIVLFSLPTIFEIFIRNRSIQEQLSAIEVRQEIIRLNQQTGPHLFFNTLSTLQKHVIQKSDNAEAILVAVGDLMRSWLMMSSEIWIDLRREVEFLENYIALEKPRLNDKIKVEFLIQGQPNSKKILSMVLIVLVENAFKYGALAKEGTICIVLAIEDNTLIFQAENPNLSPVYKGKVAGTNTGLNNIQRRLEIIYPNQYSLEITAENTYRVALTIPLYSKKSISDTYDKHEETVSYH